ncbi:Uncharacterised protein [Klebsiella oxytoca]|nr:Uncharacterised protein [Klebsiella oxytoca]
MVNTSSSSARASVTFPTSGLLTSASSALSPAAVDRGLNRQALEGFHLLRQSVHDRRQRAKGQRSCALRVQ